MRNNSLNFTFQHPRTLYLNREIIKRAMAGIGLGALLDSFVWIMKRFGTIFNFKFTLLCAKVASDSLMICGRLRKYFKELCTILSIF